MPPTSAGLLMFRRCGERALERPHLEVLLAHPGGPFWRNKHAGAWTIPKGQVAAGESLLAAARREFTEETSIATPDNETSYLSLDSIRQKGGKVVHAWAFEGDCDVAALRSADHDMEWPPRSGEFRAFPEVDEWAWFDAGGAALRERMMESQWPLVERLQALLETSGSE